MSTFTIHHGAAKPMRAVGRIQCHLLHFAEAHRGWHTFAKDARRTVDALQRKGYIEVAGDQFRFTYPA